MNNKLKYDKDRIILMSKLTVYEKNEGEADKHINDFYLHDYIGMCSFRTLIAVFTGCVILYSVYLLDLFMNKGVELMTVDYKVLFRNFGVFTICVSAFYIIIGTFSAVHKYNLTQKRIREYTKGLILLDDKTFGKKPAAGKVAKRRQPRIPGD